MPLIRITKKFYGTKRKRRPGKWHDPTKTTCRDNPRGGASQALMRATSICRAMEARSARLGKDMTSEDQKRKAMNFAIAIAQEMKRQGN